MKLIQGILIFGIPALGSALLLIAALSLPGEQVIKVGELGDASFISGFNHDEPGAPRYRWTGSERSTGGEVTGVIRPPWRSASSSPAILQLQLGAAVGQPVITRVLVNKVEVGRVPVPPNQVQAFRFEVAPSILSGSSDFLIEIVSPAFSPGNGDNRALGVKVQEVRVIAGPSFQLPRFSLWLWAFLYSLALSLSIFKLLKLLKLPKFRGKQLKPAYLAALGGTVGLLPWLFVPFLTPRNLNLWYEPYLLPFAGLLSLFLAGFLYRAEWGSAAGRFAVRLETGKLARNILMVTTLLYLAYCFGVISNMDYIGHADYADNGVVARNLVRGQGLAADYAAQFYQKYPALPRPADTWPPLQPLLIAPFFWLLGVSAFAAKLPNLLLMAALSWAIFHYGSRLFNRRVALGAALLCLGSPAFFETVAYPINDLSFTLFSWLAFCTIYLAGTFRPVLGAAPPGTAEKASPDFRSPLYTRVKDWLRHPLRRQWLLAGLWSGLIFWSKPSGGILLVAAGGWLLAQKFSNKALFIPWKGLFLWGFTTIAVILPLVLRNLLQFQAFFYSTEQRDAWLLKYYPPDERIYDLYYTNPAKGLPAPNKLLEYGFDTIFRAIEVQFNHFQNDFLNGGFIPPLLLLLAFLGLAVLPRGRASLPLYIAFIFSFYTAFITIYWHYEVRYYLAWLPWFYIFGLFGLVWVYDKINVESSQEKTGRNPAFPPKKRPLVILALAGVFLLLWLPGLLKITSEEERRGYTGSTGIVAVGNWLKQNTPGDARVMSRSIWELSFHSDRQGVMIPNNATLNEIKQVMHDYGVKYLQLDHTNLEANGQPENIVWGLRRAVWPLLKKEVDSNKQVEGFKLIYADKFGFLIYELA